MRHFDYRNAFGTDSRKHRIDCGTYGHIIHINMRCLIVFCVRSIKPRLISTSAPKASKPFNADSSTNAEIAAARHSNPGMVKSAQKCAH